MEMKRQASLLRQSLGALYRRCLNVLSITQHSEVFHYCALEIPEERTGSVALTMLLLCLPAQLARFLVYTTSHLGVDSILPCREI
ncbi:hypothetical protein M513_07718 [Trichuris suis]|uniref:Uncharacterized protein n=1 Tax=Trichuris suis TaxID=68888 RepID=A0A085M267_9BILA|nr:hypothetical protein M513_07718 [Trichuris suis]